MFVSETLTGFHGIHVDGSFVSEAFIEDGGHVILAWEGDGTWLGFITGDGVLLVAGFNASFEFAEFDKGDSSFFDDFEFSHFCIGVLSSGVALGVGGVILFGGEEFGVGIFGTESIDLVLEALGSGSSFGNEFGEAGEIFIGSISEEAKIRLA